MYQRPMRRLAWVSIVLGAGCGGDDGPSDAAVTPDSGGADGDLVTPPDIPWLGDGLPPIAIAPCPDGWREVADPDGLPIASMNPLPWDGEGT